MGINKEYIGGWSIAFFSLGLLIFIAQPNLGAIFLMLVGVWYVPKFHNYCTSKIRLKERIMEAGRKSAEKQNLEFSGVNEKVHKFTYRLYDFTIRFLVFAIILSTFPIYFAPQEVYYAKNNICVYDTDFKAYKRLNQFDKVTIYPTIKKDDIYYETSDHDYVKIADVMNESEYKVVRTEVEKFNAKLFQEKVKVYEKLIKDLIKNKLITDIEVNSLGQNVYYYDEANWYRLEYKNKKILYEALKNLNSPDNGKHFNFFYVKGSITGKTLIDILGVK